MGQRNILYSGPMIDTEIEHVRLHPEPCLVSYGGVTAFPQHNNRHTTLPPPGNRTSFDPHHLPDNRLMPYGFTQYNGPSIPSPSAGVFPVPINHGLHEQLPFSGNQGSFDGLNGAFKRKNVEGIPGSSQCFYQAPGSSSSVGLPMTTERTMVGAPSFAAPEYRGNTDMPIIVEPGLQRTARNRGAGAGAVGVDHVLAHNNSHLIPGNYGGQPLQPIPTPWFDQQFSGNGSANGAFSWNRAPGLPYPQGGMEAVNMRPHGYQVTALRNPVAFVHPPPIAPHQGPHNLYHAPPPPLRGQNMDFLPPTAHRISTNIAAPYTTVNPFQNGVEPVPRFVGPTPPTGLRVYRPHQQDPMIESSMRHHSFPHLRVLPEDEVAILDFSDNQEVGRLVDHHRDMRLDIDHMSYEELLALSEQIGSVGSGLSEEFILDRLGKRMFATSTSPNTEDAPPADQELNFCVVCQMDYNDKEKIGVVDCGHEYHVDCIKKWLAVKNTCPICKSTALATTQGKEES